MQPPSVGSGLPSDSHLSVSARQLLENYRDRGSRSSSVYIRLHGRIEIEEAMRLLGPGGRAMVTYWDASGAHTIAVFNVGGTIRYGNNWLADDYTNPLGPPTFMNAERIMFWSNGYIGE